MKELKFLGQTFQYEIIGHVVPDIGYDYYTTDFYQGTETVWRLGWKFWKGQQPVVRPKKVFSLGFSIEDANFTKASIRDYLKTQIDLLNRKEEILRGEIV